MLRCRTLLGLLLPLLLAGQSVPKPRNPTQPGALGFLSEDLVALQDEALKALQRQDDRAAAGHLLSLLERRRDYVPALLQLAICYARLEQGEQAARVLERALLVGLPDDLEGLLGDPAWIRVREHPLMVTVLRRIRQLKEERGERQWMPATLLVPMQVRLPEGHDPAKAYPLVVILHGNGASADGYLSAWRDLGQRDFIVATPQGPYPRSWNPAQRSPGWSWFLPEADRTAWRRSDTQATQFVLDLVAGLKARYRVSATFLMGHSQGGALAYLTGLRHPDQVDGLICFGAGSPETLVDVTTAKAATGRLSVLIAHGTADAQVSAKEAEKARDFLQAAGIPVELRSYRGGHAPESEALKGAGEWIRERMKGRR